MASNKKGLRLFNLPWQVFAIIMAVVLLATYLGVLPKGMTGCFVFMIVVGDILAWIGDHTPIIKTYLGGGAIVVIFGSALLVYFNLIPAASTVDGETVYNMTLPFGQLDLVGNIGTFFKTTGGFLDWYIAALITGSILGMNRKLLVKAAARYFPAIFGGLILAFGLCCGVAAIMGYPVMNALLLIALPIMGGGMGAGASPLSKIFESSGSMTAAEALSVMTPAVAIGNAVSIVLAGVLVKVISGKLNGQGALMQAGTVDPKELEISPEMQAKRDHITLPNLGIGLLVSGGFFAWGYIMQGAWNALGTGIT
ncbi:MAG: 2-hydroxycarboxylate transporter family protein, partial [Clostridia bacterium]|nr:2-hydroxycarboxylate transporter family protein [Clostridia bacterium]